MARTGRRRTALAAGLIAILAGLFSLRAARVPSPPAAERPGAAPEARTPTGAGSDPAGGGGPAPGSSGLSILEPSPSAGWEDAAAAVSADLQRILDGRPRAGAYAEARAEAARADLALFPPERARLRRLLAGGERERILALAALAASAQADDDLARLVLRSQRPEDGEVARLLGAEIAAGLAPELLARHEDELLRAFEREPNPLVLAVALPALERMEAPRLRALLRAQAAAADPEMLAVLWALARARLGQIAADELGLRPHAAHDE
jgi:hypothetical protein